MKQCNDHGYFHFFGFYFFAKNSGVLPTIKPLINTAKNDENVKVQNTNATTSIKGIYHHA
jgi:hypothetical protein